MAGRVYTKGYESVGSDMVEATYCIVRHFDGCDLETAKKMFEKGGVEFQGSIWEAKFDDDEPDWVIVIKDGEKIRTFVMI